MKQFFEKNWVFFSGLLAAIAVVLQQFVGVEIIDWTIVGIATGMAVLSYIANEWRGKGLTVFGIIGNLASTFITVFVNGHIDWKQFALQACLSILFAVAPPGKPATYEKDAAIIKAKRK